MKWRSPKDADPTVTGPLHAPPEWDALIARARIEDAGRKRSRPAPRTMSMWMRIIAPIFAAVVAAATLGTAIEMASVAPEPTREEVDRGRRALLALLNSSLEEHLRLHGEYPEDLTEVLPLNVEVEYRRTHAGYQATVRLADGQLVTVRRP